MQKALVAGLLLAPAAALALAGMVSTRSLTAPVRPLATLELRDLTTDDVRSAVAAGYRTVIVPTGGIEQNGPHMVLGKHDYIVAHAARAVAGEVGRTLVAPVVSFVPQGSWEPATGNLKLPGTIGISEQAFAGVLDGIARSLKLAGFTLICLIGDHGGSQDVQRAVAERLSREWAQQGVRVVHVDAYYEDSGQFARLIAEGETRASIGDHAGIIDTAELMAIHPAGVDLGRDGGRGIDLPGLRRDTGASGVPSRASAERGRWLMGLRIAAASRQIRGLLTNQR